MPTEFTPPEHADALMPGFPEIETIADALSFRMMRFVAINDRAGHRWTQSIFGLSLNEWRLLAVTQAKSPVHAVDVADYLLMDKSQASRLIKALVARHLMRSKTDSSDARAVMLTLTPKGKTLYHAMLAEVRRRNQRLMAPLDSDEIRTFAAMLDRLTAHNLVLLQEEEAAEKSG